MRVCSEFIKYICLAGIVLAVVIVWLISRRVTKPLHELTELSKRMAELDFDAKYTSGGSNEIGQLNTGDTVQVKDTSNDQYWYVYVPKLGKEGYVDKNYLK